MKSGVIITPGGGGSSVDSVARSAATSAQAKADEFKVVDTFADLQTLDPTANKYIRTLGYTSVADGGGATYIAVNSALTDNGGTIVTSAVNASWRWVIDFEGPPKPEWWGTPANGTDDDTSYWNEVQAAYPYMQLTDGKHYRVNFVINRPGFQLYGSTGTQTSPTLKVSPYDNAQPAITLGDDSGRLYGAALHNITFWGASTYNYGLRCAGGAYQVSVNGCYFDKFLLKAIHSEGETNHPTALIFFNNCWIQRASTATGSTVHIKNLNGANNWTTKVCFSQSHFIASGTSGNLLEVEDVEIYLTNGTHLDCGASDVAILMTKTGSPYPIINGDWTAIAESSGGATIISFTGFDPGSALSTYVKNTSITGTIVASGGNMTMARTMVQAYTNFRFPVVQNLRLADTSVRPNATSDVSNLAEIWAAGMNLYIDHDDATVGGAINIRPKAGQRIILKEVPTVAGGPLEVWSDASATYITKLLARTATPNSAISTNPGSLVIAGESGVGKLYLKYTGTGNTGYVDLSSERTITVDTLASMLANVDPAFFKTCIIQGRESVGDGGGGEFFSVATGGAWSAHASMSPASTYNAGYLWVRKNEDTGIPIAAFGAYGATTKAGSDEYTPIQAAFTWIQSNSGNLSFGKDRFYQISQTLTITSKSNWRIFGRNATIWMANSAANDSSHRILGINGCDGFYIERLNLDGNKSNRTVPGTIQADYGMQIQNSNDWHMDCVRIFDSTSDGLYISAVDHTDITEAPSRWKITNSKFDTSSRYGVFIRNAIDWVIDQCYFGQNGPGTTTMGFVADPSSGAATGILTRGLITNCRFYKNTGKQLVTGTVSGTSRITIQACSFVGNGSTQTSELVRIDSDDSVIRDCVFTEFDNLASSTAVLYVTAANTLVEKNDFVGDSAATTWTPGEAIIWVSAGGDRSRVIGNRLVNIVMQSAHNRSLILTNAAATNVRVADNQIVDCILLGSGNSASINLAGPDNVAIGNLIIGTSATTHRMGIGTSGARCRVDRNRIKYAYDRGVYVTGAKTMILSNQVLDVDTPTAFIQIAGGTDSWIESNHMENVDISASTTSVAVLVGSATDPMSLTNNHAKAIHATNAFTLTGTPRYANNNITVA